MNLLVDSLLSFVFFFGLENSHSQFTRSAHVNGRIQSKWALQSMLTQVVWNRIFLGEAIE